MHVHAANAQHRTACKLTTTGTEPLWCQGTIPLSLHPLCPRPDVSTAQCVHDLLCPWPTVCMTECVHIVSQKCCMPACVDCFECVFVTFSMLLGLPKQVHTRVHIQMCPWPARDPVCPQPNNWYVYNFVPETLHCMPTYIFICSAFV